MSVWQWTQRARSLLSSAGSVRGGEAMASAGRRIADNPAVPLPVSADVIVAGAGVVGLAAARALAAAGAAVVVVERRRVGAEASGAAAGMIAPQAGEPHWHVLPLALKARDRH